MTRPLPHILNKIRATKDAEVEALLARTTLVELERVANERLRTDPPRDFLAAVAAAGEMPDVIAEVKKASPSKGVIREDFDPEAIARAYKEGGAAALSCLTDVEYFQGSLDYLPRVHAVSGLPVLCKDFIVHPAQLYEACAHGADAVLLIARMLLKEELAELYARAVDLRLTVLLEVHDEADLEKALPLSPHLLGVNNRDLDTFVVDLETTLRLRQRIPPAIPLVAESGIESPAQLRELAAHGVAAVLVGEHLMRQRDIAQALRTLRDL